MRRFVIMLAMLAVLVPSLALAEPGNGAGQGHGNGQGPGQNSGNGGGNGNGGANGNGGGGGNGNGGSNGDGGDSGNVGDSGSAGDSGIGNGTAEIPPTSPAATDQTLARDALENGATLPLATVARAATRALGGRLIDAQLFVINKTPIYRLTVVDSRGVARRVFYDARTAKPVGPP